MQDDTPRDGASTVERACECGCGRTIAARSMRTRYFDQRCRMRAYRNRRQEQTWQGILMHDRCSYCLAPAGAVDHIDPLNRGGEHGIENLVPICGPCNSAKGDTPLLFFLLSRR